MQVNPLEVRVEKGDSVDAVVEMLRGYLTAAHSAIGDGDSVVITMNLEVAREDPHLHEMSELVAELLKESGKAQIEVAETLGLNAGTMSSVKKGKILMPDRALPRLATACGVAENDTRIARIVEIVRENRGRRVNK